jgi:hypothetical protein
VKTIRLFQPTEFLLPLLRGQKTQIRVPVRKSKCPYRIGDILWIPEVIVPHPIPIYQPVSSTLAGGTYETDFTPVMGKPAAPYHYLGRAVWFWTRAGKMRFSDMPQWLARIFLEIVDIKSQHLFQMTEEEAQAEGVQPNVLMKGIPYLDGFRTWWDSTHKQTWDTNPLVWKLTVRLMPEEEARKELK